MWIVTPETSAGQKKKNPLEIMMSLCQVRLYAGFDLYTHLFTSESFTFFVSTHIKRQRYVIRKFECKQTIPR